MNNKNENVDILTEFQSYKWVMEPVRLQALIEKISNTPIAATLITLKIEQTISYKVTNGIAKIPIKGVLLKHVPTWFAIFGIEATGYDEIRSNIEKALTDKSVNSIELIIESPGGMVAGVTEAADDIYQARKIKPVVANIEDLAASGAYWLASQALNISANRTAEIGSIGVYSVYYDTTGFDEKVGIKTIVIRSGEYKAMGVDKVTDQQIAVEQEIINGLADNFIKAISTGRNKNSDEIRELATGRLWLAPIAKEKGLIDEVINSTEATVNLIKENNTMEKEQVKIETAVQFAEQYPEIRKEVFDAGVAEGQKAAKEQFIEMQKVCSDDNELLVKCFAEGKNLAETQTARIEKLSATSKDLAQKLAEQQASQHKVDPATTEFNNQPAAANQTDKFDETTATDDQLKERFSKTKELQDQFSCADAYVAAVRHPAKK